MNVVVKTSGFYGGTWYEKGPKPVTMADKVARAFLPPYGDQLEHVKEKPASRVAGAVKSDDRKAV